ncbi:hypothetical protein VTN02DRAFT_5671 [Thermoascus thermophilus]
MAKVWDTPPVGWHQMKNNWWQWVLIGIILASVTIGCLYILYSVISKSLQYFKSRPQSETVPKDVAKRLAALSGQQLALSDRRLTNRKPSSFGVYLGGFTIPPTESEYRLLTQWDLLIVDPFQVGVVDAIAGADGTQILARIDVARIISTQDSTLDAVDKVSNTLQGTLRGTAFSGLLLAQWEGIFNRATLRNLVEVIHGLGLNVYLETAPPDFLQDTKVLQTEAISGLVIRNASILPNGEKRDYFQMANLKATIKAFVSEACMRDFVVMSWEVVDDHAALSNAVVRRAMQWCNFFSIIPWIGSTSALTDATLNTKICEPLSAFGWLKDSEIMKVHDIWRSNTNITQGAMNRSEWDALLPKFPCLGEVLASAECRAAEEDPPCVTLRDPPEWVSQIKSRGNPLSVSGSGVDYGELGCFPLGVDASPLAFAEILQSQQRLKNLGLLHPVTAPKLRTIGILLRQFHDNFLLSNYTQAPQLAAAVKELSTLASNDSLRVNLGLDSGFRKSADIRFWSVYQMDSDGIEIFMSKNAQGLAGTVLHTFLSAKGYPRHVCFEVEVALARWSKDLVKDTGLPRRLVQDIDILTPEEQLLLLQHLALTDANNEVTESLCAYLREQLLEVPSLSQLKELNTVGYLSGRVTPKSLVESRIAWYREQGCQHPPLAQSLALFDEVDSVFTRILTDGREDDLAVVSKAMCGLMQQGSIDAYTDIMALALFCAARKGAFDEIYAEVTDRNPLFNDQSDQAAAFAESFALGSRCEAYFDVSPSVFGKLLSDRFRSYYNKHQPPNWINGAPELATAYAGAQIDVDPDDTVKSMRGYQRFTFLSIFAIPALIDIILLTFVGRGLYLSAFMEYDELHSATIALMVSLLLSGAIGTWISCGGSYYLISMAFSAMNMFVLIRLIAGLAFTVAGGLIGFVAISILKSPRAGIVFYLYLIVLTAYLSVFATIACFSFPGTTFLSGRKVILVCIPILFISPIVTTFTGHDSAIYIAVLYFFTGVLLFGLRSVSSQWVTWYQKIRRVDDAELRQWYISTHAGNDEKVLGRMSDPAALKLSREALLNDVLAERRKGLFSNATSDTLVAELARDWDSTNFLLDWYSRYADVPRPIPFSSSWNIQTKVALDTLRNAQKGIRLHSAFIHWRQAGDEVGCGVLYFLVALLDKWVELLCGGRVVGLSIDQSDALRMAVGFGLAYYLIGAVLIDTKAQHLHTLIDKHLPTAIRSAKEIRAAQKQIVRAKRHVYWTTLFKFLMWHVWGLAFATSMIWTFQKSVEAMIMFCAYLLAYTGLLWYQYTKIFSGPHALKPLLSAVIIALPIGIAIKVSCPNFLYSSVIALGISTWTAAILSMWTAKIGMPRKVESPMELGKTFHAYTAPWSDPEWSQQELHTFYENLSSIPQDSRLMLDPQVHPGIEIKSILLSRNEEPRLIEAFPDSQNLIKWAIAAWEKGDVTLEVVPQGKLGPGVRALSCATEGQLKITIGVGRGLERRIDISGNCKVIAETLLHAVSEAVLRMPHEYAILSESLVTAGVTETMARQLKEEPNTPLVVRWAKKELLRQLCLGFQCDTDWDRLPKEVRTVLVNRCLGQPCHLSDFQWQWLQERLCKFDTNDLHVHIARCNLGAATAVSILDYAQYGTGESAGHKEFESPGYISYVPTKFTTNLSLPRRFISRVYHTLGSAVKFIVIAMIADPEFQREFHHTMRASPTFIRVPTIFILNLIWMYAKVTQNLVLMFFLFHGRDNVRQLWNETKGMTITLKRNRVVVQNLDGTFTAFRHNEPNGDFKLFQYVGELQAEPEGTKLLRYVSTYSKEMLLHVKQEFKDGKLVNEYHYDYRAPTKRNSKLYKDASQKLPMGRRCVRGENHLQSVQYNRKGLIEAGSYVKDGSLVRFKYHYRKNPRFGDELLRAEFVLPHMSCTVSWCAPPRRHPEKVERWIPHSKITEATFVQGPDVYECRWLYDHKFHPTIFTTLNGQKVQTPPMIENDYLGVLTKPKHTSFVHDNPLYYCDSLDSNVVTRSLGLTRQRLPVSTSRARSLLWKAWKDHVDFDGVIVRWMDEILLRRDRVLRPYWRSRDCGDLASAKKYLDLRADAVMASADLDDNISSWSPLAVKISDLFNFGTGGDAVVYTRSKDFGFDTDKTLHVLAADNGTWPNEGGGVSACRRDMINSLRTIKWNMICESANDFGIPKHQTEQNVQSLKMIPLWGLDFLTPTHGLFKNKLDSEIDTVTPAASELDIKRNFIPNLTALVKGARAVTLSNADIQQATRALVNLNTYFEDSRHWGQVWTSDIVKESWRELWLTQEMPNTIPSSEWFETELPTLGHLDTALELWFRYLFIFSVPVPERVPSVFQASHHSVSASYGVVCKIKRKCTLQIWDHGISWRETNLCLSSALCKLPPFVRNALLGLMRVTSVLVLHHADIILPCADFFNPSWEVEIGTCQGTIEHRNSFRRKVDPVVNGITDMQKFAPVKEIKSQKPTVTMLSHVWYAKDIKTALLAADIIINQWRFDDYHLDIYGAIDKAPTYSTECQEIIASKGLRGKVTLRGTADPMKVLENTWLFLNSSLSEGLPLALGEAALTGAPVVCTDVGASLRVLSDPDDFSRFSAVVAPNDPLSLARAQIEMLALLGEWSKYAEDSEPAPVLPSSPTPEDVARITQRMYEKSEHRRKLGMMSRNIVQKSFSGDRYLREHEQMLWIGKSLKLMASRARDSIGPDDITIAVELAAPIEEEVIAIPRSAVDSWRSSAASGMSTLLTSVSNFPMLNGYKRSNSALSGLSNISTETESALRFPSNASLPIFAPRPSDSHSAASGLLSTPGRLSPWDRNSPTSRNSLAQNRPMELHRGLYHEELRRYRNSDVSTVMREEFYNSSAYRASDSSGSL